MNETVRTAALDGEAPVNPYSLLEAVNNSSDTAHTAWLIFIGIMSYLLIAVAGVTHKDLLLSSPIPLPVLQVSIDLTRFFLFAPLLLVLFHLGLVSQLVMLARKSIEFDSAIRILEVSDRRTHPLRLELHNFFFVQSLAGPERSLVMSAFLNAMTWLTLAILPVVLLLYMQVVFLPYHDVAITWAHRVALVGDIALLILIGVFLLRAESSFFSAFGQVGLRHPIGFAVTTAVLIAVTGFSFLVATVPGEELDRFAQTLPGGNRETGALQAERSAFGFAMPFLGMRADGTLFGLFERNLRVTDLDLVVDKDVTAGEPTLNLRNRDLRYARLDRTDLHQADLTGADLDGASLAGADLRGIAMQCADLDQWILTEDAQLARCASARRANLTGARLKDARLAGIDMSGARLREADLDGADLRHALLAGVSFNGARLEGADLSGGVALQGADFATASLQGADMTGAKLQGADFTSAGLQGATLSHANLGGTSLRDADLEGASLYKVRLQGTDLRGSRLRAADLRQAMVWMAAPPAGESIDLADLTGLTLRAPDQAALADFNRTLARLEDERVSGRVREALAPVMMPEASRTWLGAPADQQIWQDLVQSSAKGMGEDYRARITEALALLMCRSRWASGGVATGIARRAQSADFNGDRSVLYDRLRARECPAADTVSRRALKSLATAVDTARGR